MSSLTICSRTKAWNTSICAVLLALSVCHPALAQKLPDGFVYLADVAPSIRVELRYYSEDNFVGRRINGYQAEKCILTSETALALRGVQSELEEFGLGLMVFDAYRPQTAVDHFVAWANDLSDQTRKQTFYPNVDKKNLFRDGYIASRSGHSRGSTVDLTIVSAVDGRELDMGTIWDFFDPASWPGSKAVSFQQRANRLLLQTIMVRHGFKPLPQEWWHFTLVDEPFPNDYFSFPVE